MAFTYGDITNAKGGGGQTITAYQVRLGYELQSQDIENNTSVFKLQLEARSTNSTYKTYGYNQTTTIDGTALSAKTFDMRSTNVWQIFGTRTITVTHNADGTYSASKSGSFTTTATSSSSLKSGSASVNVVLPTIPRASSITVSDANIGSGTSIMINKASDSFTTTLRYRALKPDGTYTEWSTIVTKSDFREVYPWTVPTSLYTLIPNNRTIVCEFEATTYSEDTPIGSPTTTTATFTANVYPTINSITAQTIDQKTYNLTGDHDTIIKGVSGLQISVNATAGTGASISSYVIGGETTSSSTKTIVKASSNTYDVSVYDTRGEPPTTQSITMPNSMVEYVPLTINAIIERNTPVDGNVNISFNGNYFNDTFGSQNNTLTVQYRSIEKGGSWENVSWNNLTPTISGNTYTGTTQLSNYDYTKQYEFQIRAIDEIQTKVIEGINVPKGKPIFNWAEDMFNVNGNIYQDDILLGLIKIANNIGTYTGDLNVVGNLKKNNSNVALSSEIPINNNQLINGREFVTLSGVVNEGSNSDGSFIKLESGTMICYYDSDTVEVSIAGNAVTDKSMTFPETFISTPFVMTQMNSKSSSANMGYVSHSAIDASTTGFTFRWFNKDTSSRSPRYGYIAIGKWK